MNSESFRIIVIDDNPAIHQDFIKILTTTASDELNKLSNELFDENNKESLLPKFEIDTASQGQEGVAKVSVALEEKRPYALAFVDIRMPPGWDGIETIKQIWKLDKDVQVVICTAYSDYSWEETVEHLGEKDNLLILKKPFDNIAVRQLASALTKKWELIKNAREYTAILEQQVEDRTLSLKQSLSLVKATLESSKDGILVITNDGKIIDYNKNLLTMWNLTKNILNDTEEKFWSYIQNQLIDTTDFVDKISEIHSHNNTINIDSLKLENGKIYDFYSKPQTINGEMVGRVICFRDITKRAKLESELQYQATHDSLTGLPNRVLLMDEIRKAIKSCKDSSSSFALLFFDLNRFKLVNDSLSHLVGDELLSLTAKRLQEKIKSTDLLVRLGGDEFVVILKTIQNDQDVIDNVEQLLSAFDQPFGIASREVVISASVGISIYPRDGTAPDILLRNSDAAMYLAKEKLGNKFEFYSKEMNEKNLEKLDQEMHLRSAIQNDEFFLVYQPQFDLAEEKLVAVEALIRWNHPEKGVILPLDFIPTAEETGLIVSMGEWVLRTACQQNKKWIDEGLAPIRIAVNITAQQFKQPNLVEMVKNILEETQLPPTYLELELTENVIISNTEIIRSVTALKELGVSIAIDDFGTGYSSLSYLKKIPLDRLKIDASFVQNIQSATDDEAIIRAIIAMAKSLELEVLAEGVETQLQSKFLKKQSCGGVQGFYYSKPLTSNELESLMKLKS